MNDDLKVRPEVLDYMKVLGQNLKDDLDEGELAFIKIMEETLLIDKVNEVQRRGPKWIGFYNEMEAYYDKYINPDTMISISSFGIIKTMEVGRNLREDLVALMGSSVGCGIKYIREMKDGK
jgi:hypothetical protein